MKAFFIVLVILASFRKISAENCEIDGVDDYYDWGQYNYYTNEKIIEDIHEGLISTFTTHNILSIESQTATYLEAELSNGKLLLSTNERFKNFEEEYTDRTNVATLEIKLNFKCSNNTTRYLRIRQKVIDVNTHDPVFSQDVYEYHFDVTVPEDYNLGKFAQISTTDKDFSNNKVTYTIGYTEDLRTRYKVEAGYNFDGHYRTFFQALKELKAPFYEEFDLVATDGGVPSRNSTAKLIVSVTSSEHGNSNGNENGNENGNGNGNENGGEHGGGNGGSIHPPIFAKHLYFADYFSHDLKLQEPIKIKYGAQADTVVTQSGYSDYFKVSLATSSSLEVHLLRPLPQTILESMSLIVIEIEAENPGLTIPGRTALVVHLPGQNAKENCVNIWGVKSNSTLSLVFFLVALIVIVIMNLIVLVWHFQKRKNAELMETSFCAGPVQEKI